MSEESNDFIENGAAVKRLSRDLATSAANMSADEARFLVDYYYICQDDRIRFRGQERALNESKEPNRVLSWLGDQSEVLESQVKRALDKYTDAHPVGKWMKSQHGIGPVLAAGFLAHIDITQAPTAGHIWSYAGLVNGVKWVSSEDARRWVKENGTDWFKAAKDFNRNPERLLAVATTDRDGNKIQITPASLATAIAKRPWNAELKKLCFKLGDCMIKFQNAEECFYGHIFAARKRYEMEMNWTGQYRTNVVKDQSRYDKTTEAYAWVMGCYKPEDIRKYFVAGQSLAAANLKSIKGAPGTGLPMLPPAHIQSRARRYMVKVFLSHLHEVWYETEFKQRVPNPFVIEHLGHAHRIQVPGYNSPYARQVPTAPFKIGSRPFNDHPSSRK